jgi:transcriptional regulator with XRE-family HTH domain
VTSIRLRDAATKAVIGVRSIVARVAARVREERTRKRLTFDDLALTARVARSSLIRFETGKAGIQLETLARLVVVGLELEWSAFMSTTGVPRDPPTARQRGRVVTLSEEEVARITRRVQSILQILRDAEGPQETPESVAERIDPL